MKGSYVLILRIPKKTAIHVGSIGAPEFRAGFYAYVGSAMNSIEARILRHLRKEKKKFWHIDHLLGKAVIVDAIVMESSTRTECGIAQNLARKFQPVKNFGSGDCNCKGHLFYLGPEPPTHLAKVIKAV